MHLSYSRISEYMRCPYSHYLDYIEGLHPKRPVRPLQFGVDIHKLLELRADPLAVKEQLRDIKEKFYELPANWQSSLGFDYPSDIRHIYYDYMRVYKHHPVPKITERRFEIPLGNYKGEKIVFVGQIDEMYLYKTKGVKHITIADHKSFNMKPDMDTLVMNMQKCLYAKACEYEKGVMPNKFIWDYIKSTPAKEPIWLEKSHRFSESKSKNITPYSWRRALKSKGITDKVLLKRGDELFKDNISDYFFRIELDLIPCMIDIAWESFVYTSKQIVSQGWKNKSRNITRDCKWCDFRDICLSEMTGGNTKYLIEKNYNIVPRTDAEPVK